MKFYMKPKLSSEDHHLNEMKKADLDEKSFRIKHDDDKFVSKLLSKDSSKSNPSFRVYYGDVSSSVPFTWETCPGTPKHVSSANSHIPPLTPPPSYQANNSLNSSKINSRSNLIFHNFFRRVYPKKPQFAPSSSSLSSLSWSSSSLSDPMSSTPAYVRKRRRFSSWGSSSTSSFDERPPLDGVRASRLCFGIGNGEKLRGGACSAVIVKRALLCIVGRGSAA